MYLTSAFFVNKLTATFYRAELPLVLKHRATHQVAYDQLLLGTESPFERNDENQKQCIAGHVLEHHKS
ncbi:hypothetical protein WG66_003822 [Moniliophthora roreri]|nr:hypothetical protein WG66_003822 [Moniliophthora roreri]